MLPDHELNADEWDALAAKAKDGDETAFYDIVMHIQQDLRLFIGYHAGRTDCIEEVLQESLIATYEHLRDYECRKTFVSWVKGITFNRLRRHLRELQRQQHNTESLESLLLQNTIDHMQIRSPHQSEQLKQCLTKLPARSRQLIERRYFHNHTLNHIARAFKIKKVNLASTLCRIRQQLRKCMLRLIEAQA